MRMNDFTKEELETLTGALCSCLERSLWQTKENWSLLEKLQSMIDGYCEHQEDCEHDWSIGFGSILSPVTYCKKCSCQKPTIPSYIFNKMMEINK